MFRNELQLRNDWNRDQAAHDGRDLARAAEARDLLLREVANGLKTIMLFAAVAVGPYNLATGTISI
jgi:hypothetical protein